MLDACQQVDNKVIMVVVGDGVLVAVDQHAAHERVRLEALLKELQPGPGGGDTAVSGVPLTPPVSLALAPQELHVYNTYKQQVTRCVRNLHPAK